MVHSILLLIGLALGELPPSPDLVSVCESSDTIVVAEPVRSMVYGSPLNIEYEIFTFRLHEILKGNPDVDPINVTMINNARVVGPLFNVIVQKRGVFACVRTPSYKQKKKYILFLGCPILETLYARSPKDMLRKETTWSPLVEKEIREFLSVIEECNCFEDHNKLKNIFEIAIEEKMPITKEEKEKKIIHKFFYYLNSEKVGEKAFFLNGNLAYENKIKNGEKDGLCKEYYYDGNICELACYQDDQRNGIMKEYDKSGELIKTSFWLSNVSVTEAEYKESLKGRSIEK